MLGPFAKCPQVVSGKVGWCLDLPQEREVPKETAVMGEGRQAEAPGPGGPCSHCVPGPALAEKPLPALAKSFWRGWRRADRALSVWEHGVGGWAAPGS